MLDKWFALQAVSALPDTLARVQALLAHPAFSLQNPNKVRALIGSFTAGNPLRYHAADGSGYAFHADTHRWSSTRSIRRSRRGCSAPLGRWRRFDAGRQAQDEAPRSSASWRRPSSRATSTRSRPSRWAARSDRARIDGRPAAPSDRIRVFALICASGPDARGTTSGAFGFAWRRNCWLMVECARAPRGRTARGWRGRGPAWRRYS